MVNITQMKAFCGEQLAFRKRQIVVLRARARGCCVVFESIAPNDRFQTEGHLDHTKPKIGKYLTGKMRNIRMVIDLRLRLSAFDLCILAR